MRQAPLRTGIKKAPLAGRAGYPETIRREDGYYSKARATGNGGESQPVARREGRLEATSSLANRWPGKAR
jgi:hypothetical protein